MLKIKYYIIFNDLSCLKLDKLSKLEIKIRLSLLSYINEAGVIQAPFIVMSYDSQIWLNNQLKYTKTALQPNFQITEAAFFFFFNK